MNQYLYFLLGLFFVCNGIAQENRVERLLKKTYISIESNIYPVKYPEERNINILWPKPGIGIAYKLDEISVGEIEIDYAIKFRTQFGYDIYRNYYSWGVEEITGEQVFSFLDLPIEVSYGLKKTGLVVNLTGNYFATSISKLGPPRSTISDSNSYNLFNLQTGIGLYFLKNRLQVYINRTNFNHIKRNRSKHISLGINYYLK